MASTSMLLMLPHCGEDKVDDFNLNCHLTQRKKDVVTLDKDEKVSSVNMPQTLVSFSIVCQLLASCMKSNSAE